MILRKEFPKPLYEDRELRLTVVEKLAMAISLKTRKTWQKVQYNEIKKLGGF
jgi:hypothetical protein